MMESILPPPNNHNDIHTVEHTPSNFGIRCGPYSRSTLRGTCRILVSILIVVVWAYLGWFGLVCTFWDLNLDRMTWHDDGYRLIPATMTLFLAIVMSWLLEWSWNAFCQRSTRTSSSNPQQDQDEETTSGEATRYLLLTPNSSEDSGHGENARETLSTTQRGEVRSLPNRSIRFIPRMLKVLVFFLVGGIGLTSLAYVVFHLDYGDSIPLWVGWVLFLLLHCLYWIWGWSIRHLDCLHNLISVLCGQFGS